MDMNTFFNRYKPYLAIVVAILLIVVLLPGTDGDSDVATGGPLIDTGQLQRMVL